MLKPIEQYAGEILAFFDGNREGAIHYMIKEAGTIFPGTHAYNEAAAEYLLIGE